MRTVFTNGCFDLLHVGHIDYLRKARRLGDSLIVGLNSDASIARLKGNNRPIIPQEERVKVLEAIRWVDHVEIFEEDTAENLILKHRPNVYVKGNFPGVMDSAEVKLCLQALPPIYIVLMDIVHQTSTTEIILRILDRYEP